MPELPEVETTRRGLLPLVVGRRIERLDVREPRLRWPVAAGLGASLAGARVDALSRRAKYLLFETGRGGALIVHLGMSGSLRLLTEPPPPAKHDHIDVLFDDGACLRYQDPRRFGSFHFTADAARHPLLAELGPEPLGPDFDTDYLAEVSRGRRAAIKTLLMSSRIVAGVGNIYANEALYRAGIHPARAAGRIGRARLGALVGAVRGVLADAIERGGTTLRDFAGSDGRPGYFQLDLDVYGREGERCRRCAGTIRAKALGQRASYYCARCQR